MKGFLKNWQLKVLAIMSSIVLWFFVVGIENNSYRFPEDIQIQAQNIPQGLSLASDLGKAKLRIRADENIIKNLTNGDFDVYVDLKNSHEGDQEVLLSAISKNDKVTILKADPASVHVTLEQITQKEIKIKAVMTGNPAKGYTAKNVQINPTTVVVKGGKTQLDKITYVNAEIQLDGSESNNFKQNIKVTLPDPEMSSSKIISFAPEQVVAEVTIEPDHLQKTVIVKPNFQGTLADPTKKLVIDPQTVIIQGKQKVLDAITTIGTGPLSFETLQTTDKPLKAKLIIPDGVTLADSQPSEVTISLTALP